MTTSLKSRLPVLGVGISFRPEIATQLYEILDEVDFVEVVIDNALNGLLNDQFWSRVVGQVPVVGHGVGASLGSVEPIDRNYLARVSEMAQRMRCHWFSEHLAFTRSELVDIGQLLPVQFSASNLAFIAKQFQLSKDIVRLPLLVENIAYYFSIPGSTLREVDFISQLLAATQCGLLLDVNNLYANALNHRFDAYKFVDELPADSVVEIHVAGGELRGGVYVDTHGHAVNDAVWALLDYAIAATKPNAIVLEREQNFPPMAELVRELHTIRGLWDRHLRVRPREFVMPEANVSEATED